MGWRGPSTSSPRGSGDRPPYMTWGQVQSISDAGNEIGGLTQNQAHLGALTEDQQRAEICGGRQSLLARGYPQVSFAYPYTDFTATSQRLVQECGYLSGRDITGLGKTGQPKAETIPPLNPWAVRTRGSVDVDDTLPEIEDWIMGAEAVDQGNGVADAWMNLVFTHHLRSVRHQLRRSQRGQQPIHNALRFRRAARLAAGAWVDGHAGEDGRRGDGPGRDGRDTARDPDQLRRRRLPVRAMTTPSPRRCPPPTPAAPV